MTQPSLNVLVLGGSGTAGRGAVRGLLRAGHRVTCFLREGATPEPGANARFGDPTDPESLARDGFATDGFDAVVSCLASRSGTPNDAWAIDCQAQSNALKASLGAGVGHFVLLSAICVQKPYLAFQQAKLAFEAELRAADLTHSIVRPTAFFKSLSGQIGRVRDGKPFLVFGDGTLTRCTPISDDDLGDFIALCLTDPAKHNQVLPVGGPGPALSPNDIAEQLFDAAGQPPNIRRVPLWFMRGIVSATKLAGLVSPRLADKAALAQIGYYYATESMLVWDEGQGAYSEDATPQYGRDRLSDHFAKVLADDIAVDLREHAVF